MQYFFITIHDRTHWVVYVPTRCIPNSEVFIYNPNITLKMSRTKRTSSSANPGSSKRPRLDPSNARAQDDTVTITEP